jgi:single-stranded-DNA-specific exonuclease
VAWTAKRVAYADVARLQEALDCPEPIAWTLVRRGLGDPAAAREFLAADGPLEDPEALPGVSAAADRLARAVRAGEPIVVHGDYDCDGISSTAILMRALTARGARATAFLPSRFTDGYGVADATVERLGAEGCRLLVCVDCGTTAVAPLTRAAELGMDTIVLDHHLAGGVRPPGILVNPALGQGVEALPSAAGVVFRVVRALGARLDGGGLAPAADDGIDLVALATVADAVPLTGENRRLVARGLAAMRAGPRPGIAALCRAARLEPRAISAWALGFQLAPALNAAGRLSHPERALQLLLADDAETADPIAQELWRLNMERREIEQRMTDEAVAIVDAAPPDERDAGALVVAADGWHEGVVGIVASRLVERYERPAIVIARDGDRGKGSGRSLPGVDLHALVGLAAAGLSRWGGHAGAIGLELPVGVIGRFRAELMAAAEGVRAAIARARVRRVDAVVSGADLTLPSAEALEELAPFGRGNPQVRLVLPAAAVDAPGRVGDGGRHLKVRLRSGGAHARAIGFRMGERAPGIDPAGRYDAVVGLEVERWQGMVSPKVVVQALDTLAPAARPAPGLCIQRCDASCHERVAGAALRALVDDDDAPVAPGPAAAPLGVRDRRGQGAAVATVAALAGADAGVVAVVADAARRREALVSALEPLRLGAEVAVLGGSRCDPDALRGRVALARGGALLAMLDYAALAEVAPPPGTHLVLVDPPALPEQAAWARARAAGAWLHLAYGPTEVAVAEEVAEAEWELRPAVTEIWRGLRDRGVLPWGPELEGILLGGEAVMRPPRVAARALGVLAELGFVTLSDDGVAAAEAPARRELSESARYRACQERLAEARTFLGRARTLDLTADEGAARPIAGTGAAVAA